MGAKITLVTIAQQAGVPPSLLQDYADYVSRMARQHPEAFAADPGNFVDQAVRHYNQMALAYFNEVLSNPAKFNELADQVEQYLQQ